MLTLGKILKIKGFFWSICFLSFHDRSPHIPRLGEKKLFVNAMNPINLVGLARKGLTAINF